MATTPLYILMESKSTYIIPREDGTRELDNHPIKMRIDSLSGAVINNNKLN